MSQMNPGGSRNDSKPVYTHFDVQGVCFLLTLDN